MGRRMQLSSTTTRSNGGRVRPAGRLEGAELKVGVTVSVVPGSVKGPDGTLKPAPCTIEVDGKQVADNQDGKSAKPCEYKLKD